MSTPVDALEVRPVTPPVLSVPEILFPELTELSPAIRARVNEKVAATTKLDYNRERACALLEMRRQGFSMRQIGRGLGMTDATVKIALRRARKAGILDDTRDILEHEAGPAAAEKVVQHVRGGSEKAALAVLHGLGRFRNYSNQKHEGGAGGNALPPLQVNVVFQGGHVPMTGTGETLTHSDAVVGAPRAD